MRRYIKLHTVLLTNPKVRRLPSDAARWHYVVVLLHAKQTEPEGRWLNRDYFTEAVGPETAEYLPTFLAVELLAELPDGQIAVPQWSRGAGWQRSDKDAHQADLPEDIQEQKRQRWAKAKQRQRARVDMSSDVLDVHPRMEDAQARRGGSRHSFRVDMSTNVHVNREKQVNEKKEVDKSTEDRCGECRKPFTIGDSRRMKLIPDDNGTKDHREVHDPPCVDDYGQVLSYR